MKNFGVNHSVEYTENRWESGTAGEHTQTTKLVSAVNGGKWGGGEIRLYL